jgi:hypothetical protein
MFSIKRQIFQRFPSTTAGPKSTNSDVAATLATGEDQGKGKIPSYPRKQNTVCSRKEEGACSHDTLKLGGVVTHPCG